MAISNKPRRCYHRFVEGGRFCMSPGCGVPRHYVEQAEPLPGAAEGGSAEGPPTPERPDDDYFNEP